MTSLAQLERGVVGYWCPMLQTTGLRLYDRSVCKNHGTLTNMDASTDWVTASVRGRSGRVLDFDGVNDYVDIPDRPQLRVTGSFTFACWFRRVSNGVLIQNYFQTSTVAGASLGFNVDGSSPSRLGGLIGRNTGTAKNTDWQTVAGATSITDSEYHLGFFVFDRSNLTIYLDGKQDGQVAWTAPAGFATTTFPRIGVNEYQAGVGNSFFTGRIPEAAIWNRALTASEIQSLYRLGPGWFGRREPRRRYGKVGAATTNRRRRILCGDYS